MNGVFVETNRSDAKVCPFCPLHCNDVSFGGDGGVDPACDLASDRWRSLRAESKPADSSGKPTGVRRITVGGDLGLREARRWVRWSGENDVELVYEATATQAAIDEVRRDQGFISATLGDIRQHADFVWVLGRCRAWPRLFDRLPAVDRTESPPVSAGEMRDIAARLRSDHPSGDDQETSIAANLRAASYSAIVTLPDAFAEGEEIAAATFLPRLLRRINGSVATRSVWMNVDPISTIRVVAGWSGLPPIKPGHADERIGSPICGSANVRRQWGGVWNRDFSETFVARPIAGVDYNDAVIRGDGTVTLPLGILR